MSKYQISFLRSYLLILTLCILSSTSTAQQQDGSVVMFDSGNPTNLATDDLSESDIDHEGNVISVGARNYQRACTTSPSGLCASNHALIVKRSPGGTILWEKTFSLNIQGADRFRLYAVATANPKKPFKSGSQANPVTIVAIGGYDLQLANLTKKAFLIYFRENGDIQEVINYADMTEALRMQIPVGIVTETDGSQTLSTFAAVLRETDLQTVPAANYVSIITGTNQDNFRQRLQLPNNNKANLSSVYYFKNCGNNSFVYICGSEQPSIAPPHMCSQQKIPIIMKIRIGPNGLVLDGALHRYGQLLETGCQDEEFYDFHPLISRNMQNDDIDKSLIGFACIGYSKKVEACNSNVLGESDVLYAKIRFNQSCTPPIVDYQIDDGTVETTRRIDVTPSNNKLASDREYGECIEFSPKGNDFFVVGERDYLSERKPYLLAINSNGFPVSLTNSNTWSAAIIEPATSSGALQNIPTDLFTQRGKMDHFFKRTITSGQSFDLFYTGIVPNSNALGSDGYMNTIQIFNPQEGVSGCLTNTTASSCTHELVHSIHPITILPNNNGYAAQWIVHAPGIVRERGCDCAADAVPYPETTGEFGNDRSYAADGLSIIPPGAEDATLTVSTGYVSGDPIVVSPTFSQNHLDVHISEEGASNSGTTRAKRRYGRLDEDGTPYNDVGYAIDHWYIIDGMIDEYAISGFQESIALELLERGWYRSGFDRQALCMLVDRTTGNVNWSKVIGVARTDVPQFITGGISYTDYHRWLRFPYRYNIWNKNCLDQFNSTTWLNRTAARAERVASVGVSTADFSVNPPSCSNGNRLNPIAALIHRNDGSGYGKAYHLKLGNTRLDAEFTDIGSYGGQDPVVVGRTTYGNQQSATRFGSAFISFMDGNLNSENTYLLIPGSSSVSLNIFSVSIPFELYDQECVAIAGTVFSSAANDRAIIVAVVNEKGDVLWQRCLRTGTPQIGDDDIKLDALAVSLFDPEMGNTSSSLGRRIIVSGSYRTNADKAPFVAEFTPYGGILEAYKAGYEDSWAVHAAKSRNNRHSLVTSASGPLAIPCGVKGKFRNSVYACRQDLCWNEDLQFVELENDVLNFQFSTLAITLDSVYRFELEDAYVELRPNEADDCQYEFQDVTLCLSGVPQNLFTKQKDSKSTEEEVVKADVLDENAIDCFLQVITLHGEVVLNTHCSESNVADKLRHLTTGTYLIVKRQKGHTTVRTEFIVR